MFWYIFDSKFEVIDRQQNIVVEGFVIVVYFEVGFLEYVINSFCNGKCVRNFIKIIE